MWVRVRGCVVAFGPRVRARFLCDYVRVRVCMCVEWGGGGAVTTSAIAAWALACNSPPPPFACEVTQALEGPLFPPAAPGVGPRAPALDLGLPPGLSNRRPLAVTVASLQQDGPGAGGSGGGPTVRHAPRTEDDLMKQDRKDVSRDVFSVNGTIVRGADGYDAVVAAVQAALQDMDSALDPEDALAMASQVTHLEHPRDSSTRKPPPPHFLRATPPSQTHPCRRAAGRQALHYGFGTVGQAPVCFSPGRGCSGLVAGRGAGDARGKRARCHCLSESALLCAPPPPINRHLKVLRSANRTQSGGDSYEAVTRLLGCPSLVLVVADSEYALPVHITVAVMTLSPAPVPPG
jgi:hypothetical protein